MWSAKTGVLGLLAALTLTSASAQTTSSHTQPLQPAPSAANPTATINKPADDQAAPELTPTDVNAWLDGFVPYAIGKGDIPGAVVVVVKDGQIIAERGYGYADLAKRTKVDPKTTLFRPGSISKLFTWTALMQQVQAGKVDLNGDVNKYIDFKIPAYEGKPVTVLDLMTHTPGFEEQVKDLITTTPKNYVTFETLLKRWVPKRVFAPGTTPAYSNYGASLAGYIVQRVSGEPFDNYVERHIFAPLGMQHSTFRQPLPANFKPFAAEGYISGKDKPYGYEFVGPAPAGSLAATGDDMAKFMIAHLQNGGPILNPQTAQLMHSRARQVIPGVNGMAHGFYEDSINGLRVIAHGGDTVAFHSDLHLFLDKGVGLYVSVNSAGHEGAAGGLRSALFENFADRYFPAPAATGQISADQAKANAQKIAGLWSSARGSQSNFISILDLMGQTKISVDDKGQPVVPAATDLGGQPRKWVAVGPMLWREANGHEMLSVKTVNGKPALLGIGSIAPIISFVPVPSYRSSAWLLPLLYVSLAVLLLTALFWPTRALVRRRFGATLPLEGRSLQAFRASRIMAIAILVVLAGWAWAISSLFSDLTNLSGGFDTTIKLLQVLSAIVFVGGVAVMLWYAYTVWTGASRWTGKLWSILLVIASLAILYVGIIYHLIGWATYY